MSHRNLSRVLRLAALVAPAVIFACSSTNTGSAPTGTGTGTGTKTDSGTTTTGDDNGDDDSGGAVGTGDDTSDGGSNNTTGFDATVSDAAKAATLPQVANSGGPILANPKFVLVTYNSDTSHRKSLESFIQKLGASMYWKATMSEYGIGAATMGAGGTGGGSSSAQGLVHVDNAGDTACSDGGPGTCITDDGIKAWLKSQFGSSAALGVSDTNTIYTILFPQSVTIDQGGGAYSCQAFLGYHDEVDLTNGKKIAYAVIPTCAQQMGDPETPLNNLTIGLSHELIEAASDPNPVSAPAYQFPPDLQVGWALGGPGGGELADMCEGDPEANVGDPEFPEPTGDAGTYQVVQRTWSNAVAKTNEDPCVPHIGQGYINTIPVLTDTVSIQTEHLNMTPWTPTLQVAQINGLSPKTIEVKVIGDSDAGMFEVKAVDYDGYVDSNDPSATKAYTYLNFTWAENGMDKIQATAGQVLHLVITPTQDAYDLANASQKDTRMGVEFFPELQIWILSAILDSSGKTAVEEHFSYMLTNLVADGGT